jgi:hypothetical protein
MEHNSWLTRRSLCKGAAALLAANRLEGFGAEQKHTGKTVRDCFWLFGVPANVNFPYLHHRSLMTPAEGALYLSIPNIIMVQVQDKDQGIVYEGFQPPFDQYAMALRPFDRVSWSIVESAGVTDAGRRDQIIEMAMKTPNIVGLYMDDFFHRPPKTPLGSLSLEELRQIRQRVNTPQKRLDITVTFYMDQLSLPIADYLKLIDCVALWTHTPSDLVNIETHLNELKRISPSSRVLLGCYFYDFHDRQPLSVESMQLQCETGLRLLRSGHIEGIVFLGNSVEDQGFECIEWTRQWIQKVGGMKLSI